MEVDVRRATGFGEPHDGAGFIQAPPGIGVVHVPRGITVPVRDGDIEVEVDIAFVENQGRYVVQAIRGANLTSEILHALRPPEILREAVLWALFGTHIERIADDEEDAQELFSGAAYLWARLRGEPAPLDVVPDARKVAIVALVYQLAYMVGQRPTATVAKAFGLPRSTAGRLIRQARDQGLLGPTTERKAGV